MPCRGQPQVGTFPASEILGRLLRANSVKRADGKRKGQDQLFHCILPAGCWPADCGSDPPVNGFDVTSPAA